MKKHKNKRQLAVLTVVFALTLLTAFVYAAATNTLTFTGTATLQTPKLGLVFVLSDDENNEISSPYSHTVAGVGTITATLAPYDGVPDQIMVITAVFEVENQHLTVPFYVRNTGDLNAKFDDAFLPATITVKSGDDDGDLDEIVDVGGNFEWVASEGGLAGETIIANGELHGFEKAANKAFAFDIALENNDEGDYPRPGTVYEFTLMMPYAKVAP